MRLQPILQAKLDKFKASYQLTDDTDILFEKFVNFTILKMHNQVAFNSNADLLEDVCIGGSNDTGIDGICMKIDGRLVASIDEIKSILEYNKKIEIEFIFVQSKHKEKFEQEGILKFLNGVKDFLDEKHYAYSNEDVKRWLRIKNFIFSDDVIACWKSQPIVRTYYVSMGTWCEDINISSVGERFKDEIDNLKSYERVFVHYIDAASLKKFSDENDNNLSVNLKCKGSLPPADIKDVSNFLIAVATADEFMKILITDEGLFRANLFDDNVRDYQGDTYVNIDIADTLKTEPQNFSLYNNGVTIVCRKATSANDKILLESPQIVNGCQTCSSLFVAKKNGVNLGEVVVFVKIIATQVDSLTNGIVKGTNRQNIVYDEAFEITKPFHKNLEDFFESMKDSNGSVTLFYERRSKQHPNIPPYKKTVFKQLIQCFVATFLSEPHNGHLHESKLLNMYENKIFVESQSLLPYYVAALSYNKLDTFLRKYDNGQHKYRNYIMQILYIFYLMNAGKVKNINKEKDIDKYAKEINEIMNNTEIDRIFEKAIEKFDDLRKLWKIEKGDAYKDAIKDSREFTEFVAEKLTNSISEAIPLLPVGQVVKIGLDRNGKHYGFISRNTNDVFFHSSRNFNLDFEAIVGKNVNYEILPAKESWQKEQAINIKMLE